MAEAAAAAAEFRAPSRKRFRVNHVVGSGAFGVVAACSMKRGRHRVNVAVKQVDGVLSTDPMLSRRTLREIKLLRLLGSHENIVQLSQVLIHDEDELESFSRVYVVTALMETDLSNVIKSDQVLLNDHVRFFMYQLCRGLKFLHSAGVVHRDVKPRNLLVNANCDLRICDFGLARLDSGIKRSDYPKSHPHQANSMSEYVATRWYRAPEVLAGLSYDKSIDVWATGCIMVELLTRKPLFPGESSGDQLKLICERLGEPPYEVRNAETRDYVIPKKTELVSHTITDTKARSLISRTLCYEHRLTIGEALAHSYFHRIHSVEDEPVYSGKEIGEEEFPFDFAQAASEDPEFYRPMFIAELELTAPPPPLSTKGTNTEVVGLVDEAKAKVAKLTIDKPLGDQRKSRKFFKKLAGRRESTAGPAAAAASSTTRTSSNAPPPHQPQANKKDSALESALQDLEFMEATANTTGFGKDSSMGDSFGLSLSMDFVT